MLDRHNLLKIEHRVDVKKKQEYKLIGRHIKKPGQHLFALNTDTKEVYKVELQKINTIDINRKNVSTSKAVVNPEHPMLWSINLKNAIRKFNKYQEKC